MAKKAKKRKVRKKSSEKIINQIGSEEDLPTFKKKIVKAEYKELKLEEPLGKLEENIDENKFVEFLQANVKFSPVLKKVADVPRQAIPLEQGVANVVPKNSKDNQPKYIVNSSESNYVVGGEETENQGVDYQLNQISAQPERINAETAGRDLHPLIRPAVPIRQEFSGTARKNSDYVVSPEQLERITPFSSLEKRKTEAQELESRMKKYEIR